MKTRKRFYFVASVMMLVSILLPLGATSSATRGLAGTTITFAEHTIASDFDAASSVYATDVDGDGDMDVLGAAYYADDITWWENDGSQNFTEHIVAGNFDGAISVYATDVDGDGDVDVLGAAYYADDITWWENDGNQNFTEHIIAGNFDVAYSVYATDVDGDGDVDVLGAAWSVDDITWWENDGNQNFTEHIIAGNFDGARSVYAIDVDSDGDVDVLGAAIYADEITWWEQGGSPAPEEYSVYLPLILNNAGPPPSCLPEPGNWTGQESERHYPVSFTVTSDCKVRDFYIKIPFGAYTCQITVLEDLPIIANGFSFDFLGGDISGEFDSSTSASGTYYVFFCEDTLIFPASEGTWVASK